MFCRKKIYMKMFSRPVLLLLIQLIFLSGLGAREVVTNPFRCDGFGCQYQTIIYSIIYAELEDKTFVYSPFHCMDHNYDGDVDFLKKKEWLVNLMGYFPLVTQVDQFPMHKNKEIQLIPDGYIKYFEENLIACANSDALKKIKNIFRANKVRSNYFDERYLNIAVHIRRPNQDDVRVAGTDTPDAVFAYIIEMLRKKYALQNPLFHIYSQGDEEEFRSAFARSDIVFHINESIEDTFTSLVLADVLVTSRSSFSYTAALLSEGTVYYMRFWHPPLPHWQKNESLSPLLGEREPNCP